MADRGGRGYVVPMLARKPSPAEIEAAADQVADDEAMAEYDATGGVSHEAVVRWVRSWGSPDELPAPQPGD